MTAIVVTRFGNLNEKTGMPNLYEVRTEHQVQIEKLGGVRLVLYASCWIFGLLTVLGLMVEGYLLTRYPRSDDPSSGPASYWPEDAFEIIKVFCVLTQCVSTSALPEGIRTPHPEGNAKYCVVPCLPPRDTYWQRLGSLRNGHR